MKSFFFSIFLILTLSTLSLCAHEGPDAACACGIKRELSPENQGQRFWTSYSYQRAEYEELSDKEIRDRTLKGGAGDSTFHLDVADGVSFHRIEAGFQVTEKFVLSASTGYTHTDNMREGHIANAEEAAATPGHLDHVENIGGLTYALHPRGDVDGMTDLWVHAGYALSREKTHSTLYAGIKFPTGKDDVQFESGTNGPSDLAMQPSTGAYDYLLGGALASRINESALWKAHLQYVLRAEEQRFKAGDSAETGGTLWYDLPDTSISVGGECLWHHRLEDEVDGQNRKNTGGDTLLLGPVFKLSAASGMEVTLFFMVPVLQNLNGEQQELDSVLRLTIQTGW